MGTLNFKEKIEFAKALSQESDLDLLNSILQFCPTHPKTPLRTNGSALSPSPRTRRPVSALLSENKCQLDPSIASSSPPYPDFPALTVKPLLFYLLKQ